MNEIKQALLGKARELGFGRGGVSLPILDNSNARALEEWLSKGYHAEMAWMAREPQRRVDATLSLPSCKRVVVFTLPYNQVVSETPPQVGMLRVSRYLLGRDYHRLAEKQGKKLVRWLRETYGGTHRFYVDAGPLLERAFAVQAGLGFLGKHGNLITPDGSFVFLASLLTSLELPLDTPVEKSCGSCRLCLDACPTGALKAPRVVDSRRCISYLTIEHKGSVDEALRPKLAPWLAGCDRCQEVCPYNRKVNEQTIHPDFATRRVESWFSWETLFSMNETQFKEAFQGNGLSRPGLNGLRRNAAYCIGSDKMRHRDEKRVVKLKEMIHNEEDAVVREALSWAVKRILNGT